MYRYRWKSFFQNAKPIGEWCGMLEKNLFVVLNEPLCNNKITDNYDTTLVYSYLVGPVETDDKPRLVTSGAVAAPRKGQVVDLQFCDKHCNIASFRVVDFDESATRRIHESYERRHPSLVNKNDWTVSALQEFYGLESLVHLDCDAQMTLIQLMRNRPADLLFGSFSAVPALSYEDYVRLCERYEQPVIAEALAQAALQCMERLEVLYAQNVRLESETEGLSYEVRTLLSESAGLRYDIAAERLMWWYPRRIEERLRAVLARYSALSFYNLDESLEADLRTVPLGERFLSLTHMYRMRVIDVGLPRSWHNHWNDLYFALHRHYSVVDFATAPLNDQVVAEIGNASLLLLHNAHMASPVVLLSVLQRAAHCAKIVLLYDSAYASPSSELLSSDALLYEADFVDCYDEEWKLSNYCYWREQNCTAKAFQRGYSLHRPVVYDSHDRMGQFLQLYTANSRTAALVAGSSRDAEILHSLVEGSDKCMQRTDPLCSVLRRRELDNGAVAVNVVRDGALFAIPLNEAYYEPDDLVDVEVLRLGQLRLDYEFVFFFSTEPISFATFYILTSHTSRTLVINCAPEHLPYRT